MKTGLFICALVASFACQSVNATSPIQTNYQITSFAGPLPATITGFDYSIKNDRIFFNWTVSGNQAADKFELQGSADGTSFSSIALVFGTDLNENNVYKLSLRKTEKSHSFRIRVIQKDGSEQFYPVTGAVRNN